MQSLNHIPDMTARDIAEMAAGFILVSAFMVFAALCLEALLAPALGA